MVVDSAILGQIPSKRGLCQSHRIRFLAPSEVIPADVFGWKSSNLSGIGSCFDKVPRAFALSRDFVTDAAHDALSTAEMDLLDSFASDLLKHSEALIVRSSSWIEGAGGSSFAGLFESIRNVRSFQELIGAIRHCHSLSNSEQVVEYADVRNETIPDEHLGLLVQVQVHTTDSALIYLGPGGFFLELYDGQLHDRIRGQGGPRHVLVCRHGKTKVLHSIPPLPERFMEQLRPIIQEIRQELMERNGFAEATIEAATDGDNCFVFQVNVTQSRSTSVFSREGLLNLGDTPLYPDVLSLGLKGAAMKYFRDRKLFSAPLCVFEPERNVGSLRDELLSRQPHSGGFTVRFSHERELGLPRTFSSEAKECVNWISKTRHRNWATIVHPHINVRHSFELLLTEDSVLIEHVPGMWESNNSLDPDVILLRGHNVDLWKCTEVRIARYASPVAWSEVAANPISLDDVHQWIGDLIHPLKMLRRDFAHVLPLNFHFVKDDEGLLYFLNIREGFHLDLTSVGGVKPFVVSSPPDLDSWDGTAPLLLRFACDRGRENGILEIVKRLPNRPGFELLVDFGVLSHPAMILRELGYTVTPIYLYDRNLLFSPSYQRVSFVCDRGNDPIDRIREEPCVFSDARLWVVHDREPVVDGHLLVISQEEVGSFSDGDYSAALEGLLKGKTSYFGAGSWILAERGRARFCTSCFTSQYAHAHLFPCTASTKDAFSALLATLKASAFESLDAAMRVARRHNGEYLLLVRWDGKSFLKTLEECENLPKRMIRSFFQKAQL